MASLLPHLLHLLSQHRPIVIAILCCAIVLLLLRPRPKPTSADEQRHSQASSSTQLGRSESGRRRVIVISTNEILLQF
ncbi:MAG: hypothetical protein SGPRY_011971, partial [Prymnesium sp.]